jgi:catecholate siderophore receptor
MHRNNLPTQLATPTLKSIAIAVAACFVTQLHAQTLPSASPVTESTKTSKDEKNKNEKELKPVDVISDRERETTYQPGITNIGKTPQLPRDIPQSVTVVPATLIHDRAADTMREALRNVPSLTFNAGEGGRVGDNITLRGFSVVGDLYMDGMRDVAQYNRETFNIEQLEVLRGSSSMLYGRGSTGGIINQVSKVPTIADRTVISATLGDFNYRRFTVDTNKLVADNTAVRVNLMKTDSESFRDGVKTDRTGIAPSLRFGIGTKDELLISHYLLQYDDTPDYGVPYFQGKPLNVPVNTFYGLPEVNSQRDRANISTVAWTHQLDAGSIRSVLRAGNYKRDLWAVAPRLAGNPFTITDSTVINRQRQARGGVENTITSQTDYNGKFNFGGFKHHVLVGAELAREKAERWSYAQPSDVTNPTTTVGNPNLSPPIAANYFTQVTRTGQVNYTADTIALYGQETLELTPQLKLVFGARRDHFKADYQRAAPLGPLARTDGVWSTRTGVLYQPDDFASYYAAYGTSFNPSGELYSLDDRGSNTPPEKNRNIEIGTKWELFDGNLSFRAALFRSEKTNERNTDLAVTVEQNLLSGKRHTDGVEIEAAGRITPNWEVFAGAAHLRANIDKATGQQANTLGKVPINTPDYTASLWTVYKLSSRWKIGGGLEAVGKRFANTTNTNEAPGYTRADAMLSYEHQNYLFKLNVLNLADRKYYEGIYQGHVVPGTARNVQLSAEYKFN